MDDHHTRMGTGTAGEHQVRRAEGLSSHDLTLADGACLRLGRPPRNAGTIGLVTCPSAAAEPGRTGGACPATPHLRYLGTGDGGRSDLVSARQSQGAGTPRSPSAACGAEEPASSGRAVNPVAARENTPHQRYTSGTPLPLRARGEPQAALPGQIRALPAEITKRVGRFRLTPGAANIRSWRASIPYRPWPRRPRPWWSSPVRTDVCFMFARMSRYAPAARGIRSPPWIRATVQNGKWRHIWSSPGSSSGITIELSSGLLIRGLGVQVPRGAPVLTWRHAGFTGLVEAVSGPCLLHVCSPVRT